ncbi:hypothetical protein [Streptomyces liangshanensis]|uniref:Uncharacterized protein n=1 Tax=Streptomyces liangshanensis TaxID=2717324 RepID=A0A6G9H0I6_9ACTN|nr:hypothetical protein [Streptomyces liangshanensis]QIQ04052.1 hypothetical protein HA039_18580 [Streptomyces liangshanensis]
MPDDSRTTDELRHLMVEQLMRVMGLPDDESVAHEADRVLLALDDRLREDTAAA